MDATAGATTGGAAGAFATALAALAFFKQSWSVLGTTTQIVPVTVTVLLSQGVVYSLNNAREASGRCMN